MFSSTSLKPYDFKELMTNLSEIDAALINGSPNLHLYATSPFHVTFQGCLMGRTIKIADQMWRSILQKNISYSLNTTLKYILQTQFDHAVYNAIDARQWRIWHNMRQLDELFASSMTASDEIEQKGRYEKYIKCELRGSIEEYNPLYSLRFSSRSPKPLTEKQLQLLRQFSVEFDNAVRSFWSSILKDNKKSTPSLIPLLPAIDPNSTLFDRFIYKSLKKESQWVQLEGILQQAIPIGPLAKLFDPQSLSIDEKRLLTLWVEGLKCNSKNISHKLLSTVFK